MRIVKEGKEDSYVPVRGSEFYVRPKEGGDIRVTTEIPQLDRVEKKVDRILELLEGQELSTSSLGTRNVREVSKTLYKQIRAKQA